MSGVDMGTYKEAEDRFLAACDRWTETRQPLMANATAWGAAEYEARFQLANAALHLAWHMRNPDHTLTSDMANEPDRIDYDKTGDLDDIVLNDVSMFRMERMDDGSFWIRCYRDGMPDVVFHLSSAQKINGRHEFTEP